MKYILLTVAAFFLMINVSWASNLFQDNFSSGDSLNNWDVVTGSWYVQNGELFGVGAGGGIDAWIYSGDEAWEDYTFESESNLVDGTVDLVFRSTGHWFNEYRLGLWSENSSIYTNTIQFDKWVNGVDHNILNHIVSPEPITDLLKAKVDVYGDSIKIFLNDKKVFEYIDSTPLLGGRVGLGVVWNFQGSFDNVSVYDSKVVPEPASMLLFSVGGFSILAFRQRNHKGGSKT